ncbi:hypothetical protein ACWDTI_16230 [Gordonia sp. NPDC003424]
MNSPSVMIARARDRGLALAERAVALPGARPALRVLHDFAVNDVTDRAMTLAAQAFTSILPIVILLSATPGSKLMSQALSELGVDPQRVDAMSMTTPDSFTIYGIIGVLMTIAGATSLSRALGRMYVSIWQVRKLPISGWWRWVVVLFVIPLGVVAQGFSTKLHGINLTGFTIAGYGTLGVVLETAATFVIWSVMWTLLPRLLISSQVPIRLLTATGVFTSVFVTAYLVGSRFVLPHVVRETTRHFGTLGVVFVAISWLFFFAYIVVVSVIVVHALLRDEGIIGRWMRTRLGVPKAFPPPPNSQQSWLDAHDPDALATTRPD